MSTLFIDKAGCDLDLEGESIVLRNGTERCGTLPLRHVQRVVIARATRFTGRFVAGLARAGIGLLLEPSRFRAEGATIVTPAQGDRVLRLAQYDAASDQAERAAIGCWLVRQRLEGARALLIENRQHDQPPEAERGLGVAIAGFDRAAASLDAGPAIDRLRGIEGAATAAFFEAFAQIVARPFRFTGRNRRPPRDPVNVLLSLGYTLAQFEAVRMASLAGLDTAIGLYHEPGRQRDSLGCDLVEAARPDVERWVLAFLRSGEIGIDDFVVKGNEGCKLLKAGRRAVYRSFEEIAQPVIRKRLEGCCGWLVARLRLRLDNRPALAALASPLLAEEPGPHNESEGF